MGDDLPGHVYASNFVDRTIINTLQLIGGFTAQRLAPRDRRWMMWTPGIAMLLAAPLTALAFAATDLRVAVVAFLLANICIGSFEGPQPDTAGIRRASDRSGADIRPTAQRQVCPGAVARRAAQPGLKARFFRRFPPTASRTDLSRSS